MKLPSFTEFGLGPQNPLTSQARQLSAELQKEYAGPITGSKILDLTTSKPLAQRME